MEKINVAELLKDCPKGMELDCTAFNNVKFQCANNDGIWIEYIDSDNNDRVLYLTCYGGIKIKNIETKCVIFPKGKTTWKGFHRPFKDGDIVYIRDEYSDANFTYVAILKQIGEGGKIYSHCFYDYESAEFSTDDYLYDVFRMRFATEKEKEKLFQAIKDNGYKWNAETKTLEELLKPLIEPKFKVGDKVREKGDEAAAFTISDIDDLYYYCCEYVICEICDQDNWELVSNKFDITTLVPFESRVLMRSSNAREWVATFYSHYSNNKFFGCGMCCDQCIPYEGNEHLLGKTDDCDEYFKTWE